MLFHLSAVPVVAGVAVLTKCSCVGLLLRGVLREECPPRGSSVAHCAFLICSCPFAWLQPRNELDAKKPAGQVIAVDRNPIYPIEGAILMGGVDFTAASAQAKVLELLNGKKVNIVLSDMAPNATGVRDIDHENIVHLAYSALRFALQVSYVGGSVLLKIWDGRESNRLEQDIAKFYNHVRVVKPPASRGDSAEKFLLARMFKGLKT
ncbi:rRNA methyltransferase 2, mitochondrial [Cryptotermes secundus]|uniref:rRNA methyltransferase 2, mitochondrial n=1 Tax=Cryptotermes secundus TaxID=105785 RepID=UPI000CD7AAC4|nr:rRNA methyltransferase 2, mitochondrial [Cryptotermes secundus]